MRELKVQCDCGQKFKFDVEPVNNQMPFAVNCPLCGRDGTEKANMLLRAQAGVSAAPAVPMAYPAPAPAPLPPAPAPMAPSIAAMGAAPAPQPQLRITPAAHAAPTPVTIAPSLVPPAPATGEQPRLRINAAAHAESAVPPPPPPPMRMPMSTPASAAPKEKDFNLTLGVVGAFVGAAVGMTIWFFLTKWTLKEYSLAAWGIGLLVGVGARVFGRGGDSLLGIIAASLTLVAILGGRFWFVSNLFSGFETMAHDAIASGRESAYDEQMELGKEALNAKSDDDIKAIYKKLNYEDPSDSELAEFKTKDFQKMQDVASGKITKAEFMSSLQKETEAAMPKFGFKERWSIFKITLMADPIIFLFLALGAYSAYKIGAG